MNKATMNAAAFPTENNSAETLSLNELLGSLLNADAEEVEAEATEVPVEDEAAEASANNETAEEPEDNEDEPSENEGAFYELLHKLYAENSSDEDDEEDADEEDGAEGDADDYHNKAVNYARRDKYKKAAAICMEGLKYYPMNVDLIADTIKYSTSAGDSDTSDRFYQRLKDTIPKQRWNWRAFTFAFDYLLEKDPISNEQECREIIAAYKKYLPHEEKAYMAESELESALGNSEKSMVVLQNAVRSCNNASQCALHLADKQLEAGMYEDVIETASYAIAASAEPQPSIHVPYACLLRALAEDHLLHRKAATHKFVFQAEVDELVDSYEKLLRSFPSLMVHEKTIKLRIKLLKLIRTL